MFEVLRENQSDVVKLLENSFKKNRLVHTYLFFGAKGTMKKEAAKYLASLLLCESNGACGKCSQCESISNDKNHNIFVITPDGQSIKKEQILELEHEFSRIANEKRIFIIEHIDRATQASANSLLKFLEESGDNNYGVLLTENINIVLPTIKSRSQTISFKPINRHIIYQELIKANVGKEIAAVISTITNEPEKALEYAKDEEFKGIVEIAKEVAMSFELENSKPYIVFKSKSDKLLKAEKRLQDEFLGLLITLQNDKLKYLLNPEADIVFRELIETNEISLEQEKQIQILEIMIDLKTKIRYNLSMELAFLNMLIEIERCIND